MQLPLTSLFCVGHYNPLRKGWELEPSQREMIIKYHPKKPLSRQIAITKFQRILKHPHVKEVMVDLGYYNSLFAGYSQQMSKVPGYYLNGKVYTKSFPYGRCYMWTVPFNVDIGKNIDVYGAKPNPRNGYIGK